MPDRDVAVKVYGLSSLRKGLRELDPAIEKEMREAFKRAADKVAITAGALAPRRSGELAHSIRPYASGNRIGVRSTLPYAAVVHWGGTIRPRGTAIHFKRTEFVTRAAADHADELSRDVAAAVQQAIDRMAAKASVEARTEATTAVSGDTAVDRLLTMRGVTSQTHYVDTLGRVRVIGQ